MTTLRVARERCVNGVCQACIGSQRERSNLTRINGPGQGVDTLRILQWQTLREPAAMESTPHPAETRTIDEIPSDEVAALVESARALQHAANAGAIQPLLRGKKFGLICGTDEATSDAAALLDRAAGELGAQVARIRPRLTEASTALDVQQTAHLLGRLYDAVVCEGMAPTLVRRLSLEVGVPVYDRITSANHLITELAGRLGPAGSFEDNRRFVLQALLLRAAG